MLAKSQSDIRTFLVENENHGWRLNGSEELSQFGAIRVSASILPITRCFFIHAQSIETRYFESSGSANSRTTDV